MIHWLYDHADIDLRSLYRTVCEEPDAAWRIRIMCDRLEEVGESAFAEFVRGGIELANKPCHAFMYSCYENGDTCLCNDELGERLRARQLTLFAANGQAWFGDLLGGEVEERCTKCPEIGRGKQFSVKERKPGQTSNWVPCEAGCVNGRVVKNLTVRVPCRTCSGHGVAVVPQPSIERDGGTHWNAEHCQMCGGSGGIVYTVSSGLCVSVACTMAQYVGERCTVCRDGRLNVDEARGFSPICPVCHGLGRTGGLAATLFARFPVPTETGVRLTDKRPQEYSAHEDVPHGFVFCRTPSDSELDSRPFVADPRRDFPHWIPGKIFDLMTGHDGAWRRLQPRPDKGYSTAELADAALRRACWRYGRGLAKLEVANV